MYSIWIRFKLSNFTFETPLDFTLQIFNSISSEER